MLRRFAVSMQASVFALLCAAGGCATSEGVERDVPEAPRAGSGPLVGGSGAPSSFPTSSAGALTFGGSTSGAGASGAPGSAGKADSGSGAGGRSLWFDDFEDSNLEGWIADHADPLDDDKVGNWAVVSDGTNHVFEQQTVYSEDSWAVGGDVNWTDQRVSIKVRFSSIADESSQVYLAARYRSPEAYYFLYFRADGSLRVRKRFDGSTVDVIPTHKTNVPALAGTWYTLALEAKGTTISAWLNGALVGTASDASVANGGVAVGVVDATAAFDDVTVSAP